MGETRRRLLPLLLAGSLLVHMVLYANLARLYQDDRPSVIELSVEELVRKPAAREIPRPRFRAKPEPLPQELVRQTAEPQRVEAVRPPAIDPVDVPRTDTFPARVEMPGDVAAPDLARAEVFSPSPAGGAGFGSAREYYDMVRLKIESKKRYPRQAKAMRREGRVTVTFLIGTGGTIGEVAIARSSGNSHLDKAALQAVTDSAPLPVPPRRFFSGPQRVELTIVFELL